MTFFFLDTDLIDNRFSIQKSALEIEKQKVAQALVAANERCQLSLYDSSFVQNSVLSILTTPKNIIAFN